MPGKRVTELDTLPSFTDASLLPVHNGAGLKKGTLTQLLNYLGNKFSNPNLLINPDFAVNQRGEDTYEIQNSAKYTVDRWKLWNAKVSKIDNGIKLENNFASIGTLQQKLEKAYSDIGLHLFHDLLHYTKTAYIPAYAALFQFARSSP